MVMIVECDDVEKVGAIKAEPAVEKLFHSLCVHMK